MVTPMLFRNRVDAFKSITGGVVILAAFAFLFYFVIVVDKPFTQQDLYRAMSECASTIDRVVRTNEVVNEKDDVRAAYCLTGALQGIHESTGANDATVLHHGGEILNAILEAHDMEFTRGQNENLHQWLHSNILFRQIPLGNIDISGSRI